MQRHNAHCLVLNKPTSNFDNYYCKAIMRNLSNLLTNLHNLLCEMSVVEISALAEFFSGEEKLIKKGKMR